MNENRERIDIHVHCDCQNRLLQAISDKLDRLIDSAGDKEKLVALTAEMNTKAAQWSAVIEPAPDASKEPNL